VRTTAHFAELREKNGHLPLALDLQEVGRGYRAHAALSQNQRMFP
jgi:hypothetical protein